jgi:hypothetical protein
LTHRATSFKQSLVISLVPIGALGMMATVYKGSDLTLLKMMLSFTESDIRDAAHEVGCGVAIGDALPRMDENGHLICDVRGNDFDVLDGSPTIL